jgi:hypothetical protein
MTYFLTQEQVVARWVERGTPRSLRTLQNWRSPARGMKMVGPPFKHFGKKVMYPLDLLEAWEENPC